MIKQHECNKTKKTQAECCVSCVSILSCVFLVSRYVSVVLSINYASLTSPPANVTEGKQLLLFTTRLVSNSSLGRQRMRFLNWWACWEIWQKYWLQSMIFYVRPPYSSRPAKYFSLFRKSVFLLQREKLFSHPWQWLQRRNNMTDGTTKLPFVVTVVLDLRIRQTISVKRRFIYVFFPLEMTKS